LTSPDFHLSVVVPCHNAEKFLMETIGFLYSQLNENEELIVVENGSTDNTLVALNALFSKGTFNNVTVVQSPKGLGLALKQGIEQARGKMIVFMEDDLPFGLQELELVREIDATDSYFILSKYHGTLRGLGLRRMQGLIFIFLRELILGLKVKDSQATFFGDAKIIRRLAGLSQQKGFLVTLEFIALARKLGVKICEVPCGSLAQPIRSSTLKPSDVFQMFIGLFRVKSYLKELDSDIC